VAKLTLAAATLVGRDAELAELLGLLDEARTGGPRVALVCGDPGIGKTALVQAVAAAAGLHVRCGFEDAPTLPDGSRATSNAQLVEIATRLADGSQPAIRHTKIALNNWLRLAGPAFDASLALEFLDMTGPDVREGVAAVREKRKPEFG
jgi:enoyl-CoA hydratase/carnithine racemase